MSRGLTFQVGGFYHIYNRGTEKRTVFTKFREYERFLALLYIANCTERFHFNDYRKFHRGRTSVKRFEELLEKKRNTTLVDLCAYVLMPNHFHLLVHESTEGGISKFMHKLLTAYTMYFNALHERNGALFQGKFKARDANGDRYLQYLLSYIHLNPIKLLQPNWKDVGIRDRKEADQFLSEYRFSSYLDYCGKERLEHRILNISALPEYLETPKDIDQHISDWLNYPEVEPR